MLPPVALSDHVVPVRFATGGWQSHVSESRNILSRERSVDTFVSMGDIKKLSSYIKLCSSEKINLTQIEEL